MSSIADRGISERSTPTQSSHEKDLGLTDRTLVGETTAKKYDDATGFVSEGQVLSTDMDNVPENRILLSHIHPSYEPQHTIKKILSRPVKIDTITYDTASTTGGQLATYNIMDTIRNNAGFALAREKLSTFYGVNWRAHLKITLNAQPFEVGLFQIYFQPFIKTIGSQIPTNTPAPNTIPFSTGCPNVLCNIALQSEVELSVPYSGPTPFINLTNNAMDFGNFYVQTIVPIADSTNNASCELSVYMFFSEIELFGTTPCSQITIAVPQGKFGNLNQAESRTKTHGRLGTIVETVGDSLVPLLDMLGLSAPTTDLNPPRRHIDPYSSPSTADTVKSPLKVSYLSNQAVDIGFLGVDNNDECDINHVISKPTYYDQFSWAVTNDAPAVLNTYPVEPNNRSNFTLNNYTYVAPTRLRYMSNIFKYWRGTIKFTFHVIANKFHSGRLRFVYTLGGNLAGTGQTPLENFPRSFTQVVDIRDSTSFEVECEYFGTAPWRVIPQNLGANGTYVGDANIVGPLGDIPGTLTVCVENELRAATTTTQSIQIVCMVSAGKDFEFSVPIAASSLPVDQIAPAPARLNIAQAQSALSYQSLSMVGEDAEETQKNPSPFTTGEDIKNVRTLLRRYQLIGAGTNTLTQAIPNTDFILYPYYLTTPITTNTLNYEMLCYFRKLYFFYRGSIRYLLTTSDDDYQFTVRYNADISQAQPIATAQPFGNRGIFQISAWPTGTDFSTYPLTSTLPYLTKLQGGIEIEFPYYSRYHKSFTKGMSRTSPTDYQSGMRLGIIPNGSAYLQMTSKPSSYANPTFVRLYRTVGDDFNFGYLLGAPIVTPRVIN